MDYEPTHTKARRIEYGCYLLAAAGAVSTVYGVAQRNSEAVTLGIGNMIAGLGSSWMARVMRFAAEQERAAGSGLEKKLDLDE